LAILPFEGLHEFGKPEIDDLGVALARHHDVGWLEIAVHHAFVVRQSETLRDFRDQLQRAGHRQPFLFQDIAEFFAFDELQRDEGHAVGLVDLENGGDVRMVQRRCRLGFPYETAAAFGV
jgi:hypothetical protein